MASIVRLNRPGCKRPVYSDGQGASGQAVSLSQELQDLREGGEEGIGRLRDEDRGVLSGRPDHVDLFRCFVSMLKLTFDPTGDGRSPIRQGGNEGELVFRCSESLAPTLIGDWNLPATATELGELPEGMAVARLNDLVVTLDTVIPSEVDTP